MTDEPVDYRRDDASAAAIERHLTLCDADFRPPLSARVGLEAYARKLADRAARFEAWSGDELIGLVAAYCDGAAGSVAFVTNVSVDRRMRGRGVGDRLIAMCIDHATALGLARVELRVGAANAPALRFYDRHGFVVAENEGEERLLRRDLAVQERTVP